MLLATLSLNFLMNFTDTMDITRFDLDGSNPFTLYNDLAVVVHEIALDHYEQNVYWIENRNNKYQIRYTNLYGGEVKTFVIHDSPSNMDYNIEYLAVDHLYVYFVSRFSKINGINHLLRAGKFDGAYDINFDVSESRKKFEGRKGEFRSIHVSTSQPREMMNGKPCQNSSEIFWSS